MDRSRARLVWLPFVLLVSATAQDPARPAGERGLPPSAPAPSFMPRHLTGPHAGKTACPLCVHGNVPQLQIWVQEDQLAQGLALERALAAADGDERPVRYLVLVPAGGGELRPTTAAAVQTAGLGATFVVQVPSWSDAATSGQYGHADHDRPALRVYALVNRRVFRRWDEPALGRAADLASALVDGKRHVLPHAAADAQIAPAFEPGERMRIVFRVVGGDGKPLVGAKVSAMQADANGLYNPAGWNRMTPRLSTVAWTDRHGRIVFDTIHPGAYPSRTAPAHIHFSVGAPGRASDRGAGFRTLWFEGDPLLIAERRQWAERDAETVIVPIARDARRLVAEHTFVVE
jgi:protocatechuate 3,4-dioxygenase beta subunit